VNEALAKNGSCIIVDGHSFCDDPIVGDNLPDFCIGADEAHTPPRLAESARSVLEGNGYTVMVNYPYAGSIVPLKYYKTDLRVSSIMIEVNKRLYLKDGTLDKSADFNRIKRICSLVVQSIADNA
jgi:N-formylglutamate amidohydrolase